VGEAEVTLHRRPRRLLKSSDRASNVTKR
jgi:hypothetical protein